MDVNAIYALSVVVGVLVVLVFTQLPADFVLIGGVAILLLKGILDPSQALSGLSNEGMVTVALLFVVGAGVTETAAVDLIAGRLLGRPKSIRGAISRLMGPTTILSAFMNNTPLVAVMIPAISDWAKKQRLPVSKLMIPLSYAAILGGVCTLIGTSTNLVIAGMLVKRVDPSTGQLYPALGMFDISWVGIPIAIVGCVFIIFASGWLLPDRRPPISQFDDPREYTIEMLVPWDSPLVNQSIEQAGLRHLPGLYLAEIDRGGVVLPAVSPDERLRADDRLVFFGVVGSMVDLQKMRGLVPATDQVFKLTAPRSTRCLTEAVVSNTCPLVGKSIREGRFRTVYNAAVVAAARNGERLTGKIGDIVLQAGDTLLLESLPSFVDEQRNNRDFFLVSRLEGSEPPRHDRAWIALIILGLLVLMISFEWLSPLKASLVAAALMIVTRCCSLSQARQSLELSTLLSIAAALSIGTALETTNAAKLIADNVIGLVGDHPHMALAVIYLLTVFTTEIITNNAAAALMFPFAMSTAERLGVSYMPFVIAVMVAASSSFATPISYQTNLMVYGPGGYRFSDYLRVGVPLDLMLATVGIIVTPLAWPF